MDRATAYLYTKQMQALHCGLFQTVDSLRDVMSTYSISGSGGNDEATFCIIKEKMDACLDKALKGRSLFFALYSNFQRNLLVIKTGILHILSIE